MNENNTREKYGGKQKTANSTLLKRLKETKHCVLSIYRICHEIFSNLIVMYLYFFFFYLPSSELRGMDGKKRNAQNLFVIVALQKKKTSNNFIMFVWV